jgi:protein gp37
MSKRLAAIAAAGQKRGESVGRTANYLNVIDRNGRWNGRVHEDDVALDEPYRWKKPRVVFVNSMSDLFQDALELPFVQRVFEVMNNCPQHTFQILTKRPEIAAEYAPHLKWTDNIWMGTSVENNLVRGRIGALQKIKAKVRFLSVEPLIGPIPNIPLRGIHWVIVGGESGPGARPMEAHWVRQIRDKCRAHDVAFFFKQWGGLNKKKSGRILDGRTWDEMPFNPMKSGSDLHGVRIAQAR